MWRLSTRLFALTTFAAVLPAAMGSWSVWSHYRTDGRQAAEQVGLLAQALAGEGGRVMGSARQLLDVLTTFPSVNAQEPVHCGRVLSGLQQTLPHYALLAVTDRDGRVFCSSRKVPQNADVSGQAWFQRTRASHDGFAVGDYAVIPENNVPVLHFAQRTATPKGDVVVFAALDLRSLSASFTDLQLPPDARISVIDRSGRILYRYPDPENSIGQHHPDRQLIADTTMRRMNIRYSRGVDGIERIAAVQPLSQSHDTGIIVHVGRATDAVLAPARRHLLLNLFVLALSMGVASWLAWTWAGAPVAAAVRRLSTAARAFATGDAKARVGRLPASQEINDLAASFDQMADTLAHRQNELESALERLETSTDLARIGIFDWDVESNAIVWNKQHFQLFGYDPEADRPSFDAFLARLHPEDAAMVAETLDQARRTGSDYRAEYRIALPGGEVRWILGVGRYTYDATGRPARMRGVVMDVTERRKAEDTVRRVQKMDALGQMTGGIAHDINNILGIISANLQLIEYRPSQQNIAEGVATSLAAANRGADLVRRLLAFSRRQPDRVVPCDVRLEIDRVKPLLEKSLPKSIALGVFIPDNLWRACMDPAEFGDALLNLAINSAHAMPKGGRLHVEATNFQVDSGGLAQGIDLDPGDYVVVAVSDDGCGIAPDVVDRVFEPFFTTKERSQGSGLGLSMVYGFARRCGGTARIYSELGRGTTVRLYLPRAAAQAERAAVREAATVRPGGGETVLVVDDETGFLRAAETYLRDLGYRTLIAERPAEALALAGEVGRIDLLFSDVVMPGPMTGIDLANRMRAAQPDLKVLLTTGFAETAPGREESGHGYAVLAKPYRLDDLGTRVRALLDGVDQSTASI